MLEQPQRFLWPLSFRVDQFQNQEHAKPDLRCFPSRALHPWLTGRAWLLDELGERRLVYFKSWFPSLQPCLRLVEPSVTCSPFSKGRRQMPCPPDAILRLYPNSLGNQALTFGYLPALFCGLHRLEPNRGIRSGCMTTLLDIARLSFLYFDVLPFWLSLIFPLHCRGSSLDQLNRCPSQVPTQ